MDWFKLWPILVTLVGLIGAGFTLKADVDSVKESLGPPGSLPISQYKTAAAIEQLGERVERLEGALEKQGDERSALQQKVGALVDLLTREREKASPSSDSEESDVTKLEKKLDKYFDRNNRKEWTKTQP